MKNLIKKASMTFVFGISVMGFSSAQALATTFLVDPPEDNGYAVCTPPTAPNFTVSSINTALNPANTGDIIYVCPKYATSGAGSGAVVAYNETLDVTTGVNLQGLSDNRGSRVTIAANPGTNVMPSGSGQAGIVVIRGSAAAAATFGNFVVDGAVGAANGTGPAGTVTTTTTNYTGTNAYNGIVVAAGASSVIIYNSTVQNIRSGQTGGANSDGDGIVVLGTGSSSANAAGTSSNPVQITNNVVQNFRSDGITAGTNSYVFVRGNYVVGSGNGRRNGTDQTGQTTNQAGIQFTGTSNGDIFNNRLTNLLANENTTSTGAACVTGGAEGCPAGIVLDTTSSSNGNALRVRYNNVGNTFIGILGQDVQFVNMSNNTIFGTNNLDGISLVGSSSSLGSNFNTVTLNTIYSARRAGIFLGLGGGDASLSNTLTQNTIQDSYTGIANNPPAANNTVSTTGVTANTFINVDFFVSNATSGPTSVANRNDLP